MNKKKILVAILMLALWVPAPAVAQYEPEVFFEVGGSRAKSAAAGDFNGDGFDDLVVSFNQFPQRPNGGGINVTGNVTTKLVFLMGSANNDLQEGGSVSFPEVTGRSSFLHRDLIAGDFNGDGLSDVGILTKKEGPIGQWDTPLIY